MAKIKKDIIRSKRRLSRVRFRVKSVCKSPRVAVFRSLKHIYAQIIDSTNGSVLAGCSSLERKAIKGDKKNMAKSIGLELSKRAKDKGINKLVFDRGRYLYHGRVQSLADGLRDGGIQI